MWRRWVPHRSPAELENYGFENLESLGAVYSRISSHIFGDWNTCGKVRMGGDRWRLGHQNARSQQHLPQQ